MPTILARDDLDMFLHGVKGSAERLALDVLAIVFVFEGDVEARDSSSCSRSFHLYFEDMDEDDPASGGGGDHPFQSAFEQYTK